MSARHRLASFLAFVLVYIGVGAMGDAVSGLRPAITASSIIKALMFAAAYSVTIYYFQRKKFS